MDPKTKETQKVMLKEEKKKNKEIEKFLKAEERRLDREIKLLLLGAGESGKSTIAKQMKILHLKGFPEEERIQYREIIHENTLNSMQSLIVATQKMSHSLEKDMKAAAERVLEWKEGLIGTGIAGDIKDLWADKSIQAAYQRRSEFQLNDSAEYFFEALARTSSPDYVPTDQDILRARVKTTGVYEIHFKLEGVPIRLVDVGGQKSERKKWLHCFEDVTAIIFCAAMNEYDMVLREDGKTNRMLDSLQVFDEICNNKWFSNTSVILFLNKKDLFEDKIEKVSLKVCFPDYNGKCTYEDGLKFIQQKYNSKNKNPKKQIYIHDTCATDTQNILKVWNAVKDIILRTTLDQIGI